jgi:hypothetical protein
VLRLNLSLEPGGGGLKQPSLQAVCEALADAERMLFEEIAKFKPIKLNDSSKSPEPSAQA